MSKNNLNVLFYVRKNYVNKEGKSGVMIRITLNGDKIEFSSTLNIDIKDWDSKAQKMLGRSEQAKTFNEVLFGIKSKILENYTLLKEYKIPRTLKNLRDSIQDKDFFLDVENRKNEDKSIYLLNEYKKYIHDKAKTIGILIQKRSWGKLDLTFRKLSEFIYLHYKQCDKANFTERDKYVKKHKSDVICLEVDTKKGKEIVKIEISQSSIDNDYIDIRMSDIDYKLIKDFETYLAVDLKLAHNSKSKDMQNFRGFINYALNMNWLQRDPFYNIKITFIESDRTFLPEDDLKKIMSRSFGIERLEHIRDIFIFCCYTGFAFCDAMDLTKECIHNINEKLWIVKPRMKTNTNEMVPLLDIPNTIIKKHEGLSDKGYLLPRISNQKMNAYLKEIADLCGIKMNLTSHCARHTFATLTLNNDIPLEVVGKMLGHKKASTTAIYAKMLPKTIAAKMVDFSESISELSGSYI